MIPILLLLSVLLIGTDGAVICYECYANSTEQGKYCSIDKLCEGTSCYFQLNTDNSWSAGCSSTLSTTANVTCSASTSTSTISSSCSCNSDFCNSLAKSKSALVTSSQSSGGGGRGNGWWGIGRGNGNGNNGESSTINLTLPDRNFVHCEECGSVTVGSTTIQIPCDHNHTCEGNYCVSVRGQAPYSYCGGVWDVEKAAGCYYDEDDMETCLCSMNMCNFLREPAPLMTTQALSDPTLATIIPPVLGEENAVTPGIVVPEVTVATGAPGTTVKPTTKRKCKNAKLSPNDQAVFMGEKLKNVILGGFGSGDGAVQNFEDDINDHICNYSDDE
ncbi:hypothetical protein B9Z55_012389 [Caenorhabditis nigoni]|uniref:DUF7741 domain-containing protein n=1 Tax=Caenorhabditis nigoni TaxID=1611254 RepID=A0A2G5TWZ7_9PELO|nr:hypothetical protein B9Z55_012389 [Caenorhabditis nigoni]